jgi:hypothetical protein
MLVSEVEVHAQEDMLIGRLIHRLTDAVYDLDVGIGALHKNRKEVMLERAEFVAEVLREEIANLKLQQAK